MARSVTFNGITQYRPGGLSKVNANALNQVGLATNGVIGVIGESDGGVEPGTVVTIDDPAQAIDYFRSGPLADAIQILFDPSDDPRVPGGAFRVYAVRTNQATRGSVVLYNKVAQYTTVAGSTSLSLVFAASTFTADEFNGCFARIGTYSGGAWSAYEDGTISDTSTDTLTIAAPGFAAPPASGVTVHIFAPMVTIYSKDYGAAANGVTFEYEPGAVSGQTWTTSMDGTPQVSEDIGSKSYFQLEYVGQSTPGVPDSGTALGTHSTTTLQDTTKTWTVDGYQNYFAYGTFGAVKNLRKIASNTADTLTVTNAFSSAPIDTDAYEVRTGMIHSGAFGAAGGSSQATLASDLNIAANELANMVLVVTSGDASGSRRSIVSNTAGVSSVATLDHNWETGKVPAALDTYEIRYVTTATATIAGAAGVATGLTTSVAVNGGAAAAGLDISFTSTMTLTELVNQINGDSNYQAYVPAGINGSSILMTSFDFDLGATAVDLRNDRNAVSSPANDDYSVVSTWPNNFRRDLQLFVDDINAKNDFVTATRSATAATGSGAGRPAYTGGSYGTVEDTYVQLTGGHYEYSTNSTFQAAFDLLLNYRCNHVVPLISADITSVGSDSVSYTTQFASVAAQLVSHLGLANGVSKSERGGYIGMAGTHAQLLAQANNFNNADVQLVGQKIQALDATGTLKQLDEWSMACVAAGMRAGMPEVGEPLTWKYFRASSLTQDSSWDPLNRTDANLNIQYGILFAEFIDGKGYRWVRDLTTYVQDDNLAYMTGSTRDVLRYYSYGLRTFLEDRFTGIKARPANASSIKEAVSEYSEEARTENIIVDGEDDDGNFLYAYHNIRVNLSGNIARVRVGVIPAVGIDFQLTEIFLTLPQSSA